MTGKMTDDTGDAGCLLLACLGILLAFALFALTMALIIIVVRGGLPGC
jgi:hypothetical protein